jgi:hypothetical protein
VLTGEMHAQSHVYEFRDPVGDRDRVVVPGARSFLDLQIERLEDAGEVDVVFDVIGGNILARSTA